ncbi:MAG: nucleotidyltransferase family protein [Chloroflexota bacterium]
MAGLEFDPPTLEGFCRRWSIAELSFFGSVLRSDFRSDSDIDVLVSFEPSAAWGLFDLAAMERELGEIFGRSVDIVTRNSVEQSRNELFRKHVLEHVRSVYLA